jgi:hypothetical protein
VDFNYHLQRGLGRAAIPDSRLLPLASSGRDFRNHGDVLARLSPHPAAARQANLARRSVAVYYSQDRPPHQTAPAHGTIYYQRPLPGHIQPGHILGEEDAGEIQTVLARRTRRFSFCMSAN